MFLSLLFPTVRQRILAAAMRRLQFINNRGLEEVNRLCRRTVVQRKNCASAGRYWNLTNVSSNYFTRSFASASERDKSPQKADAKIAPYSVSPIIRMFQSRCGTPLCL